MAHAPLAVRWVPLTVSLTQAGSRNVQASPVLRPERFTIVAIRCDHREESGKTQRLKVCSRIAKDFDNGVAGLLDALSVTGDFDGSLLDEIHSIIGADGAVGYKSRDQRNGKFRPRNEVNNILLSDFLSLFQAGNFESQLVDLLLKHRVHIRALLIGLEHQDTTEPDVVKSQAHNMKAHSFSHQLWVAGVIKRECASSCGELQPL